MKHTTKQWPWPFLGASLALESALELLSPVTELIIIGCHIKSTFLLHITIQSINGSLLLHRIRENDISRWQFFGFVVSSWGTHLLNFLTFSICFKGCMTTEWSTLISLATSCVVLIGSASMKLSIGHCQRLMAGHCQRLMAGHWAPHLQGSSLLWKTSWTTPALYIC